VLENSNYWPKICTVGYSVHVQDLKYFRGSDKLDLLVYNLSTSGTDQPTPFLYRIAISYTYVTAKTVRVSC
jgi:hypothetical protein